MTPEALSSPVLDPLIYEPQWDDEKDLLWKGELEQLVNGTLVPLQVAQRMNSRIRTESNKRFQALLNYANTHTMTAEHYEFGAEWGDLPRPNSSGLVECLLIRTFSRMCSAFSPYSVGQNRLFALLEALRDLPRWIASEGNPDENGNGYEIEFWTFGRSWIGLENEFRRSRCDFEPGCYRDIVARNRWRNFQHTMARLTASNLIYCAPFNCLPDLVKISERKTRLDRTDFYALAAAQWIIWPTECRYVYQECLKRETIANHWEAWSKKGWGQWKAQFARIADSPLYDDPVTNVARQALQQMKDTEEEIDEEHAKESTES
ncbi:hypothetical protein CC86DRAFT_154624 [Ophiobolus disseminans]|uniref:Uncharacterized protein n=1 Tax=Ophiobolus disseminans TaxID=1469910 RepID=A0A6A6ZEL5_9PLEO|nr:hypothetical protein CC86DRAFT_154624 [Ophiobolus disseminans]